MGLEDKPESNYYKLQNLKADVKEIKDRVDSSVKDGRLLIEYMQSTLEYAEELIKTLEEFEKEIGD